MAPVGKWRQGKDLLWYSREKEKQLRAPSGGEAQSALELQLKAEREQIRREEEDKRRALLGLPPLRVKAEQPQHESATKQEETGAAEQRQRSDDGRQDAQPAVSAARLLLKGSFVGGSYRDGRADGRLEPMHSAVFADDEQRAAEAQQTEDGSRQRLGHGVQAVETERRTERERRRKQEHEERRERRRSRQQRQPNDGSSDKRERSRHSRERRVPSRSRSPRHSEARRSASPAPSSSASSSSRSPSPSRFSRRRRHKRRH